MSGILSSNPEGFNFNQVRRVAAIYETSSSEKRERRRAEDAMNKIKEILSNQYQAMNPQLREECVALLSKIPDFENLNMMIFASAFQLLSLSGFNLNPGDFSSEQCSLIIIKIKEYHNKDGLQDISNYHAKMAVQLLRYCRLIEQYQTRS